MSYDKGLCERAKIICKELGYDIKAEHMSEIFEKISAHVLHARDK